MSTKPATVTRLNDLVLGCFARVQHSDTLDHLVRFLGTWSGSDKLFMLAQYILKLIVPFFRLRVRLQHKAGLRSKPVSHTADGLAKLAALLGDSRTLWRIWGLLPIFQWLISLERKQQPTRNLLLIERLQGWSMLVYYPLEHLSYLGSHGIIPSTIKNPLSVFSKRKSLNINHGRLGLWSCRFWAVYVILQFAHLREDRKLLLQRQKALRKAAKGSGLTSSERQELAQRWDAWWSELVVNLGYLPLTIHWSLEQGLFKNDIWIAVFGLVAGIASFRSGWHATALPLSSIPPSTSENAETAAPGATTGYDVSS